MGKRYVITRMPPYLMFHVKRFKKNKFRYEKNPTIVNFPISNLEMKQCCASSANGDDNADFGTMSIKAIKAWCTARSVPTHNIVEKDELVRRAESSRAPSESKYDLVGVVSHDTLDNEKEVTMENANPAELGVYRAHVARSKSAITDSSSRKTWYRVENLTVRETPAQEVAIAQAYIMVYAEKNKKVNDKNVGSAPSSVFWQKC